MSFCIRARRYGWIAALAGAPATPGVPVVSYTATAIVLDWAINTEADVLYYQVSRRLTGAGQYVVLGTRTGNRYTDSTAVVATGYDYQIVAIDAQLKPSAAPRTVVNALRAT
jgi:fibronectin type 3 domain-containing protein